MADVFTHFNYLHTIPEIGMKEFKTSAYVADVLKQLGYEVETQVGGATGVVAVCDSGKPGPVLGLRADMDALGTKDGGAAHLCGHDGHMAMLLAAAEEIMKEKLVRKGKLKLLSSRRRKRVKALFPCWKAVLLTILKSSSACMDVPSRSAVWEKRLLLCITVPLPM